MACNILYLCVLFFSGLHAVFGQCSDDYTIEKDGQVFFSVSSVDGSASIPGGKLTLSGASGFSIETSQGLPINVGKHNSLAIGQDGKGIVSFYDITNGDLKVAHCNDVQCSGAVTNIVDWIGDVGLFSRIAIGSDGFGIIAYYDATMKDLKVAHCKDVICSAADIFLIDASGDVGRHCAITIAGDGLAVISYYDITNMDLKVAKCVNVQCSTALLYSPDTAGNVGQWTASTTGVDGFPLISYYDVTNVRLKVLHCTHMNCSSWESFVVDSTGNPGFYSDIVKSGEGRGLISYYDNTTQSLKVAHCQNTACSVSSISVVASGGVGSWSSITVGGNGFGLIAYRDNNLLKLVTCSNYGCNPATITTVTTTASGFEYSDIAIGSDNRVLITFYALSSQSLQSAHCSTSTCSTVTVATIACCNRDSIAISRSNRVIVNIDEVGIISSGLIQLTQPAAPFEQSNLIPHGFQQKIASWTGNPYQTWKICHRNTDFGTTVTTFHERCDNRGPTVTVIKTANAIFGGHSKVPWYSTGGEYRGGDDAFIFSVTNQKRYVLGGSVWNRSIYTHTSRGPSFGSGHDISMPSLTQVDYCNFPNTYMCNNFLSQNPVCTLELCGISVYNTVQTVLELEVYVHSDVWVSN